MTFRISSGPRREAQAKSSSVIPVAFVKIAESRCIPGLQYFHTVPGSATIGRSSLNCTGLGLASIAASVGSSDCQMQSSPVRMLARPPTVSRSLRASRLAISRSAKNESTGSSSASCLWSIPTSVVVTLFVTDARSCGVEPS